MKTGWSSAFMTSAGILFGLILARIFLGHW